MSQTRTFKTYNFVTGAVDGTLAYDFSSPLYIPQEETVTEAPRPRRRERVSVRDRVQEPEWVKEEVRERARVRTTQGFSPLAVLGAAAVAILFVMILLAQIQVVNISSEAAALESQIETLQVEHTKLTVEYEAVFNLKDVEEYAVNVLGMMEPREDQIFYLTNVSSADRAVVITEERGDMFSLGLEDMLSTLKAYFS